MRFISHRHGPATLDFLQQMLGRGLGERGEDAQAAGIGDGSGQFGAANPHHAALDDRVAGAQQLGDSGFHVVSSDDGWGRNYRYRPSPPAHQKLGRRVTPPT